MSSRKSPTVTAKITEITPKGTGLLDTNSTPVYVPYTAIGDIVTATIIKTASTYKIGKARELRQASGDRRNPQCAHFGRCGGCQLQHISAECQQQVKTKWLTDALKSAGINAKINPIQADSEFGYRNKFQATLMRSGASVTVGINRLHSPILEPIDHCELIQHSIHIALPSIIEWAGNLPGEWEQLTIRTSSKNTCMALLKSPDGDYHYWGPPHLFETIEKINYRISPHSFFQGNTALLPRLLREVISLVSPQPHEIGLEIYGGLGLFGLALAKKSNRVKNIELNPSSVADARFNAAHNHIDNYSVVEANADDIWPLAEVPDYVVVDPPRTGLSDPVRNGLLASRPRRIVYVSCNLESFVRDLSQLTEGYSVQSITPFDMFPNTIHTEVVALLQCR